MQGRGGYLRLDMNENPDGLPREFVEDVLSKITPEFLATYPEPDKLTELLGSYHGMRKNNIYLTNGSDEAIKMIFQVFGKPGKGVVTVNPTFAMYDVYCEMFGMKQKKIQYDDHLNINSQHIIQAIDDDTSLVILLNPNNPIGNVFDWDETERIVKRAKKKKTVVVIDEAYHYFYPVSFLELINRYDNVIILRTFSKMFSLAACRLGYAISNEQFISYLRNAGQTFQVNAVALKFGEALIQCPELIQELETIQREGKKYLCERLKEKGHDIYAGEGNYVFVKIAQQVSEVEGYLKEHGVLVKTYHNGLLKNYIRVTTGSRKTMEQFLEIFFGLGENTNEGIVDGSRKGD